MSLVALCSLYMPKSFNFVYAFNCYKQKCKLAPFNLAHPVFSNIVRHGAIENHTRQGVNRFCKKSYLIWFPWMKIDPKFNAPAQYRAKHYRPTQRDWTTYTRQIENQQAPCSLDTKATISSNLTKDISSLVYCLTMFDVCHMFVLKYYLRPIFNSF